MGACVTSDGSDDRGRSSVPDDHDDHEEEHNTQGTMVLMLFFLVVIIGIWGSMFLLLLQRG